MSRLLNAAIDDTQAGDAASDFRNRWIARACSCDTRDSLTPISAPIRFIVTSRK
jgi:hypothetical protein